MINGFSWPAKIMVSPFNLSMAMRHELADFALQNIFCNILHPLRLIQS